MNHENLTTFYSLFAALRFHVPDYQRGYSWEEAQWKALIDDLSTLTDHNDHFTGLLVLHESQDPDLRIKCKGVIKDVFDVVDGQQRLTTIVILLGELHRAMKAEDDEDLQEIADDIVPHYLYAAGPGSMLVPHLVLDRLNHNFFTGRILGIGPADMLGAEIQSHRNLLGAQAYFREYLNQKSEALGKAYPDWLAGLYEKIANQMKVMVYKLKSEADAGVVFESMNNRGKKPNQLDLVKNYLLFLASKLGAEMNRELTGRTNEAWEVIFKQLTAAGRPEDEETLLQMHWLAACDHDLRHWNSAGENKSNLIKRRFSLLDYLDRYDELFGDLQQYVASLRNAAVAFADLSMPEDRSELSFPMFIQEPALRKEVIRFSQKLRRIGIMRPFTPLLLAARLHFPGNAHKYLELVKLCERYSFRVFTIAMRRPNSKESVLFRLAHQLYCGQITFETLHEQLRRDLLAECPDTLLRDSFSTDNPNPWYGHRDVSYFLYEYEEHLFGANAPVVNWQSIHDGGANSVEHILPQHPEEDGYWAQRFPDAEERVRLTHQVGNLTLVLPGENSSLGRKPFDLKKGRIGQPTASYANSDLKITKELAGLEEWTPGELAARQERLKEWALERWAVEAPPPLPDEPWERMLEQARRDGLEKEFLEVDRIAGLLSLHRFYSKRGVVYKPPHNYTLTGIYMRTEQNWLNLYIRPVNIPVPQGFPGERASELLGEEQNWWVTPDQFESVQTALVQLADEVAGHLQNISEC